jgi:DNA-binding CsgD family transcriptional regulator
MRRSEGLLIAQIARVLGISRNTVKAALAVTCRRSTGGR